MTDDWTAAQHADELLQQQRLLDALEAAERAGTPKQEVIELAGALGLASFYREKK